MSKRILILCVAILLGSFILIDRFYFRDDIEINATKADKYLDKNDSIILLVDESIDALNKIKDQSSQHAINNDSLSREVAKQRRILEESQRKYQEQISRLESRPRPEAKIITKQLSWEDEMRILEADQVLEAKYSSDTLIRDTIVYNISYQDSTVYLIDTVEQKVPLFRSKKSRRIKP